MTGLRRRSAALVGAVLVTVGLAACDPVPSFTVDATGDESDANPGDGICASTAVPATCTLRAAIEEGNALGRANITVAQGIGIDADEGAPPWTIAGELTITHTGSTSLQWTAGHVVIEPGASLLASGLRGVTTGRPGSFQTRFTTFDVQGALVLERSVTGPVTVADPGVVVAQNSAVVGGFHNDGVAHLRHVTLFAPSTDFTPHPTSRTALITGPGAETHLSSSLLAVDQPGTEPVCAGPPPVSGGYNLSNDTTCGLDGSGDVEVAAMDVPVLFTFVQPPPEAARDLIPFGVNGCGTEVTIDLDSKARPADATGTGTPACDSGPLELAAPPS